MANQMTLDYIKQNYDNYEDKMLAAFVGKPDKFWYYKNAFSKFNFNGIDKMKWVWSWWAFFGNFWFLWYRKAYVAAFVCFVLMIVIGWVPVLNLVYFILVGGYSVYFIYKTFKRLKMEIEHTTDKEDERIAYMIERGGYNTWVIWLYIIINILAFVGFMAVGVNDMNSYSY